MTGKTKVRLLFFMCLIGVCCNMALAQSNCQLKQDKEDIKVYTCPTAQSKFKAVKANFAVNASYKEMVSMLMDVENFCTWQYRTKSARILKKVADNEVIYYIEFDVPWPASNRDLIVQIKVTQDPATGWITLISNSLPDYLPKKDHTVRVQASRSSWLLKSDGIMTKADYYLEIDPGGSLPAWLINLYASDGPWRTFKNLKEKIHAHKNMNLPFIVNK